MSAPLTYRVWITCYPGSSVDIKAHSVLGAMQVGARTQRAAHTGETVEINAVQMGPMGPHRVVFRKLVRIERDGRLAL